MNTIRMDVEYDGTDFAGWQRQSGEIPTVQASVESVLSRILQEEIRIVGAGRTDRGVHARSQTASFTTGSPMELGRLMHSTNSLLPRTVRVSGMRLVSPDFHARFSATAREYRYFLLESPSAIDGRFAGCCHMKPDLTVMNSLASMLVGSHDFTSFSKEDPQQSNAICTVTGARWYRYGRFHVFQITANRFLRSMVRFLVAAMVEAGTGGFGEEKFRGMLRGEDRSPQLVPAQPSGLFLWKVFYP